VVAQEGRKLEHLLAFSGLSVRQVSLVLIVTLPRSGLEWFAGFGTCERVSSMAFNSLSNGKTGRKRRKRRTPSVTTSSAEEYKVGPGRPPKEYQFKPGQSGNPKGAKRKPRLSPDIKLLLEQALSEKVTLKQGEKQLILTMAAAGIKQLVAQYARGDRHARRDVIALADKFGVDLMAGHRQDIEEALPSNLQEILHTYVARYREVTAPSASSPVLAPPELLDDDTTEQG
jgi:hypothetical protein